MRLLVLLMVCSCGSADALAPVTPGPTCDKIETVPAPAWSGWRSGGEDPCVRLTKCAEAGCEQATCLHGYYGCLDSGTLALHRERQLGTAYWVTVACCP